MPILSRFGLKQSKWKSFVRQLQNYGFQRQLRGPEKGLCRHELFVRGRRDLCLEMRRIKKSYSSEYLSGVSPPTIPRLLNDRKFSMSMPSLQQASFNSGIRRSEVAWSAGLYTQNDRKTSVSACRPLMPRPILGGPAPFNCVLRPREKQLRTENGNCDLGSLTEWSSDEMNTLFLGESSLEETFSRESMKAKLVACHLT